MIIYFSGTGNSRFAAELLADVLGDSLLDSGAFMSGQCGGGSELSSEKPFVFVCPTYAWRIPRVFERFIRGSSFASPREAYFVMTCGDSVGAAGGRLARLCADKGLRYMGLLPLVMPENYIAMFSVPTAEQVPAIVGSAAEKLRAAAPLIASGRPFPSTSRGGGLNTGLINPLFYAFCVKDRRFKAEDACVGCGICADACPLGNIRLQSGRPVWGGRCTHCMACITRCPKEAIEYGRASVGKPRYRCIEYSEYKKSTEAD